MERCSFFIKDKALFGSYPTQENVQKYEEMGVKHFVDLTYEGESKITKYKTESKYIQYPIKDRKIPTDCKEFSRFIITISNIILDLHGKDKVYIHCKGGHGRSGIVVASLLCYLYRIPVKKSIELTTYFHNKRTDMKDKWRQIGSPQTRAQKNFVTKLFDPLYIYTNCGKYFTYNYHNDANFDIQLDNIGKFKNVTSAINYMKEKHKNKWKIEKDSIVYNIIEQKFSQNSELKKSILSTGLRPIVYNSKDKYNETNMYGKLIMKLRNKFYIE